MILRSLFLISFLLLANCSSPRSYYVLSPAGPAPSGGGIGIGIGPVTMADYLVERPYLVFQSSPNKMEISSDHVWGGDLGNDFTRVLASNIGRRKHTGNTRTYPWEREKDLKYQITIDVRQFHGTANGDAVLEASWRVYALPDSRLITSKTSILREPLLKDGYEALAATQSKLIDRLAAEISTKL